MPSLTSLVAKYRKSLNTVVSGSCREVSHESVELSPVLSGSLVLSWSASIGSPSENDVTLPVPDEATTPFGLWNNPREQEYKATAQDAATNVTRLISPGQDYYFTNPKPYATEIEYEGVSYQKAPAGMRDIAVAQWQSIVDEQTVKARGS